MTNKYKTLMAFDAEFNKIELEQWQEATYLFLGKTQQWFFQGDDGISTQIMYRYQLHKVVENKQGECENLSTWDRASVLPMGKIEKLVCDYLKTLEQEKE